MTGLTLTSAGIGYPATTTIPVTFFFPFDVTGLNPIGACSVLPTAHAITDTDGSIDVNGLVLDTPGEGCTTAPNVEFLAPHTVPATAFATLGTVVVGNCTGAFEVCGFVVEIVSNQIISGGPITTTTQNGLLLGEPLTSTLLTPPNFVAGFPALVYATAIAGDEACTHCGPTSTFPPTVAISFGNGLGTVPALSETVVGGVYCFGFGLGPTGGCVDPALPFAAPPNGVPMVDGESLGNAITLDTLGNAYVSGQTTITNFVLAEVIGNESVLMRRRVNARGFPTDPTTQTGGVRAHGQKSPIPGRFPTAARPQWECYGDALWLDSPGTLRHRRQQRSAVRGGIRPRHQLGLLRWMGRLGASQRPHGQRNRHLDLPERHRHPAGDYSSRPMASPPVSPPGSRYVPSS